MKTLISILVVAIALVASLPAQTATVAKVAGTWQMSMDSPHGQVQGPLEIKQDGAKITGTYAVDGMGTFNFTGTVDGKTIKINLEVPGADHPFGVNGSIDANKMSGKTDMGGDWSATRK